MSDTAQVGIRILLDDYASVAADLIVEALRGINAIAPAVTDDLNLIANSLMDLGAAAELAVTPLENIMEAMGNYDEAATTMEDANIRVEESLFNLSDDLDLMGQSYQMYSDNVDKAVAANDLLDVSMQMVQTASAPLAADISNVGTAATTTADAVNQLSDAQRVADELTVNHTNDFMQQMAVYQASQSTFNAFSGALEGAVKSAGDLQEALTNIQIATGATDKDMQGMEQTLIAVANNSKFTATDVGSSFTLIAERGFTATDIIKNGMGQAAVNFAEAVHGDLIPSTTLLTGTMQVFGAKAQDAEKYASALTYAFYHGIPNVQQLQQALANVAGEANALNIPIEDVIASLDFLVQHGLSASTAGNSLRYMLSALTDPTSKASQELAALGIESINASDGLKTLVEKVDAAAAAAKKTPAVFDGTVYSLNQIYNQGRQLGVIATDQSFYQWAISAGYLNSTLFDTNGNLKPLPGMLQEITDAINKLPDPEQKMAAIGNLFNVRSGQGALQFTNDPNAKQKLTNLSTGVKQAEQQDTAGQDATKIMSDFTSKVDAARTSLTTLMGVAVSPLVNAFTPLLGTFNDLLGSIQKTHPEVLKFVAAFLIIGTLGSVIGLLYGIVTLFTLTGVLLAGGVIAAVLGFATLGGLIYANWSTIAPILQQVGNAIASVMIPVLGAGAVVGILWAIAGAISSGVIPSFFAWVAETWAAVTANAADAISIAGLSVAMYASMIPALLATAAATLAATWPWILLAVVVGGAIIGLVVAIQHFGGLKLVMGILNIVWHQLVDAVVKLGNQIKGQFMAALKQLEPTWKQLVTAFNQAKPVLVVMGTILGALIGVILAVGLAIVMGLINTIGPLIGAVIGVVAGIIRTFMGLVQFFMGFFILLGGIFTGNTKMIQQGWDTMGKGLYNAIAGIWDAIKSVFTGAFGAILGFFGGFGASLANSMTAAMKMMGAAAQNAVNVVLAPFKQVVDWISGHLGFHSPTKEGPLSDSDQYMPNFMKMMASGINNHKHLVTTAMKGLTTELSQMPMPLPPSVAQYHNIQSAVTNGMNNQQHTTNLYVDSKKVATAQMDLVTGQLKMQGLGRAWR
jgi:hypothetical protein